MMATSVLILPNLFEPAGKTLHAAAELPGMKIFRLQVGIGVHSYFCMSDNRNVIHPQKFFVLRGEYPVSVSSAVPVVCGYPPFPLVGVTAFGPPPQQFIENIVDVRKRLTGTDRSMIVRPARICWFSFSIRRFCFQALPRPRMVSDKLAVNAFKDFFDGFTMSFPLNFRKVQPSISNPSSMWVMSVFSSDSSRPLVFRKSRISSLASSAISFVAAVTIKSSAYRTRFTLWALRNRLSTLPSRLVWNRRRAAFASHPAPYSPESER